MKRFEVEITECKSVGKSWTTRVLADSESEAIDKAVPKLFGRSTSLHREHDNCYKPAALYGQVVKPARNNPGAYNCLTGKIRIDVSRG